MTSTTELLTIHEAGRILDIKPRSVGWCCQKGKIRAIKVRTRYGPSWRMARGAVDDYDESRQEQKHTAYVTVLWCPSCNSFHRADKESDPCSHCHHTTRDYNLVIMPEEYLV